jgi:outer membrane protein OmpU
MNKLTKAGVSALCGSLAAVSAANAGEMSVAGYIDTTWMSLDDAVTGNPLGMGSNYSISGSSDLENGWTVKLATDLANAGGYSNTSVTLTIPGLGDVRLDQGLSATGIHVFDDATPTVWEEADGAGLSAGIDKISGVSAAGNIQLTPSMTPDGLTATITYSADADGGSQVADRAAGGDSGALGAGWDVTLTATDALTGMAGLKLYGGLSRIDQYQEDSAINDDKEEIVVGFSYAAGGFTIGAQRSDEDNGRGTTNTGYDNLAYSVVFNVNDDLSIGYQHSESERESTTGVTAEADAITIGYSYGGASFRLKEVQVDNQAYTSGTNKDATILSMGIAF